jgi:hypothetical protein
MTIGVSLVLIAAGAILVWGVTGEVSGLDVDAVGVILMVVGLIGALLSLIFWSSWSPMYRRRAAYVDHDPGYVRRDYVEPAPRRRREVIVEDDADLPPPGAPVR